MAQRLNSCFIECEHVVFHATLKLLGEGGGGHNTPTFV